LIRNGKEVCDVFDLPNELKDYKVKVTIKPISIKPKKKAF